MRKIRVLHMIPEFGAGGAERLVVDLMDTADRKSFDVFACSLYPESGRIFEKQLREKGLNVFYMDKKIGPDFSILSKLYVLYRNVKPDVVHTHRYLLRYCLPAALLAGVPVKVHTVHNIAKKEVDAPGRLLNRAAFRYFGVTPVGISDAITRTVKEEYGLETVPQICNGVRTRGYEFSAEKRRMTRKALDTEDSFTCIHVGRFSEQKNHALLIRAFSRALGRMPNMTLLLVGDGELKGKAEVLVKELGVQQRVRMLGIREDIASLLFASDLFIFSSDWEGLPLTVIEAMAAKLPVVSTRVGGVPDLVEDGRSGYLVEKGDERGLAEAIMRVAEDPNGAKGMGEEACKVAQDRFDISRTTAEYEGLYASLLHKSGRLRDV